MRLLVRNRVVVLAQPLCQARHRREGACEDDRGELCKRPHYDWVGGLRLVLCQSQAHTVD